MVAIVNVVSTVNVVSMVATVVSTGNVATAVSTGNVATVVSTGNVATVVSTGNVVSVVVTSRLTTAPTPTTAAHRGGSYAGRTNESAPKAGALPKFNRSEPQAATLLGLTSRSLLEFAIGIDRGFIASGISRTRSTCRSPFSRLAPLTLT